MLRTKLSYYKVVRMESIIWKQSNKSYHISNCVILILIL